MTKNKVCWAAAGLVLLSVVWMAPNLSASQNDFRAIVNNIETKYHVRHSHGLLMGIVGFAVRFTHPQGVKELRLAIFEDCPLLGPEIRGREPQSPLQNILGSPQQSGWQPFVSNISRRTGEYNYIYAQGSNRDMRLLVLSLEPTETVVVELRMDADKFSEFVNRMDRKNERIKIRGSH